MLQDSQIPSDLNYYRIAPGSVPSEINNAVLMQQLLDSGTTGTIFSFIRTDTTLVVLCDVEPIAGDKTIIDAVCLAHVGTPFGEDFREYIDWTIYSAPNGTAVIGPDEDATDFRSGKYQIDWYAEMRHTENGDSLGYARVSFSQGENGGALGQRGSHASFHEDWVSLSGLFVVNITDGSSLQVQLKVQSPNISGQSGATGRLSEMRRCRVSIRRMGD